MDKPNEIDVSPYLPTVERWKVLPYQKFLGKMTDKSLIYEMWLTPQAPEDTSYCIFMCRVIKEAVNSRFGKVLDCAITYGWKITAEGATLNPKFLFDLQLLSFEKFQKEYEERNKDIFYIAGYIMDTPTFEPYKASLERVFLMRGVGIN